MESNEEESPISYSSSASKGKGPAWTETNELSTATVDVVNLSKWMENLPNEKQLCPITQITLPGSHNSASFWFDVEKEMAPDKPKILSMISDKVGLLDTRIKLMVKKWALTQEWDIKEQLVAGVRYFDFRIAYREESDDYRFVHGLYGHKVEGIFEDVKQFLLENRKEVVLLDFNHLYNMETEENLRLGSLINHCFGHLLHSPRQDMSIASLQELWLAGEQVIVFYDDKSVAELFPSFFANGYISSSWPNTDDCEKISNYMSVEGQTSRASNKFHVTQAIGTPQTSTIIRNPRGSLKTSLACKVNKNMVSLLQSNWGEFCFNIVSFDHVDCDDLVSIIIGYNYVY